MTSRIAFCLLIVALAAGCSQPTATSQGYPFQSGKTTKNPEERHTEEGRAYQKDKGISIVPPKGWVRDEKAPAHLLPAFIGPEADGFATLNVTSANGPVAIEELGPALKKNLAAGQKQWKCVDEGTTEIDGKKTYFISSQFVVEKGDKTVQIQNVQFFVPSQDNKKAFVTTFTASSDKFQGLRKRFEDSAQSIRVD